MQTWDLAKLLLGNCSSTEDVDQILLVLNNAGSIRDICSKLEGFSSLEFPVLSEVSDHEHEFSYPLESSKESSSNLKEILKTVGSPSGIAQAYQLEALLRASGKTNKQIEQWVTENFEIRRNVGKGSLRLYLARVLNIADLKSRNRILAAAYELVSKDIDTNADIVDFWDELDKRFVVSDE